MRGGSLYHFFLNTEDRVNIHSLDINLSNLDPVIAQLAQNEKRLCLHHSDSRTFDYSPYKNAIDFIFIDGGHDFEIVKNDTEKALEMLSEQGIIVWDDYNPNFKDVWKYLNSFSQSHRNVFHIKETSLVVWDKSGRLNFFEK